MLKWCNGAISTHRVVKINGPELSISESYYCFEMRLLFDIIMTAAFLLALAKWLNVLQQGYIEPQSQSLISVVKHADEHFAASRRTSFLSSARSVMLGDYHNSVTMSSEAALWRNDTGWGPTQVV